MTTQIKGDATSTFGGEIKTNNDSIISNRPIVSAYLTATVSISEATNSTIPYNATQIDTDNAFNTSTYKFTVPTGKAGKYWIHNSVRMDTGTNTDLNIGQAMIYKNGALVKRQYDNFTANYIRASHNVVTAILDLAEGDTISGAVYGNTQDNGGITLASGTTYSNLYIYKLIG